MQTPTRWSLIGRSITAAAASVIAQQYSSATCGPLHFHPRTEKLGALFKNVVESFTFLTV
jgi:hypothetical protein